MDKPKSPPPPPPPPRATTSATANNRLLKNIKSLLIKCAIASNPAKKSLTPLQEAFIEKRIEEIFPNIHTPDHPPYAWMIENAIRELNEEGGSSEESISKFILQKYKDLPFAHVALLNHHLRKLSESNDLVRSRNGCYSIGKSSTHLNRTSEPNPTSTNTSSLIPVLTPSPSPSPSPSCSSSAAYESSSSYSSSESFSPKGRKKVKRKKSRKARGIKIRTNRNSGRAHGRGRGRGGARGRGRGSGSGCSKPEDTIMGMHVDLVEGGINRTEANELKYLTVEDGGADENIGIQDSINVESRNARGIKIHTNHNSGRAHGRGSGSGCSKPEDTIMGMHVDLVEDGVADENIGIQDSINVESRNARGIKIHTNHNSGRAHGRGSGSGCSKPEDTIMGMHVDLVEDGVADENIGIQDSINVESRNARGIKIDTNHNSGRARGRGRGHGGARGRGRGRGRGSGSGCSKPEDTIMGMHVDLVEDDEASINHTEATELKYLTVEDGVADENIGIQDSINVESRNARGIKIDTNHNSGRARGRGRGHGGARGRGRGRGRGSGSGCSKPEDTIMGMHVDLVEDDEASINHTEATELKYLTVEDGVADENIGIQDSINVESRNARGIKIDTNHNSGRARGRGRGHGGARGRGRGRGRGSGSGCSKPEDTIMGMHVDLVEDDEASINHTEATELKYLTVEDGVADENIGIQDSINVESQNARGIKIHTNHNSGRARGRGSGSGCSKPEDTIMGMHVDLVEDDEAGINRMEATELKYLTFEDSINVESRALESAMVIETEALQQEKLVSGENSSTPSKIRSSRGKTSRSVRSMHAPRSGRRRGRPRKGDVLMEKYGENNMANVTERDIDQVEQDDDQYTLDELIDEVYMELVGATEIQTPATETHDQSKRDGRELIEIRDHAEGMHCDHAEGRFGLSTPEKTLETIKRRKLRPRPSSSRVEEIE